MAIVRLIFAAKEAAAVYKLFGDRRLNSALLHQIKENLFVDVTRDSSFPIIVQQCFRRSEGWHVNIFDSAKFLSEPS